MEDSRRSAFQSVVYEQLSKTPSVRGRVFVFPSQFALLSLHSCSRFYIRTENHHKPHNNLSFHLCFPSRLLKNSTPNPGNPTKFDLLIRSLILTMFLLNILCSRLFFGNSLSSIIYNYNYSCMPNTKQNIDCHNKSTLQSRMNMNFTSVQNNDC